MSNTVKDESGQEYEFDRFDAPKKGEVYLVGGRVYKTPDNVPMSKHIRAILCKVLPKSPFGTIHYKDKTDSMGDTMMVSRSFHSNALLFTPHVNNRANSFREVKLMPPQLKRLADDILKHLESLPTENGENPDNHYI